MGTLLRTPNTQLGILLTLIFATAFVKEPSISHLLTYVLATVATAASDLLFRILRRQPLFFPSASLVSGTIIALVLAPQPSWQHLAAAVLAMASKNFLRFPHHIFNPAAFGLFTAAVLFGSPISWWGVSWQQSSIYLLVLLSPVFVSLYRIGRYLIVAFFLIVYALLNQLPSILDPTILFFSLVMLPEPMTSPTQPLRQMLFGFSVAILSLLLSFSISNFVTDPLLIALLLANLAFFRWR